MERNTVTRTFSIGTICSRTKASDDFSTARRHSSAGIRALLWATSSAKSLGCSLGSDFQTSRENVFTNILTPDSIPQFTIPSLSVQSSLRSLDKDTEEEDAESEGGSGSSESSLPASLARFTSQPSGSSLVPSDRRAERSVSDPLAHRRALLHREMSDPFAEAQHCLDPASRAALSLPHLAKVTTPYGFVTLSQSPQMASEEALLCQAGLRRLNKDEESGGCTSSKAPGTRAVDEKGNTTCLQGDKKRQTTDSADSHGQETSVMLELTASPAAVTTSTTPRLHDGKCKRNFYKLIKKHFTSFH